MKHTILRGAVALTGAAALALGLAGPATAGPVTDQRQAARWLAQQTTDGVVHNDQYDFDDLGLTVDVALALVELDRQRGTLSRVTDALAGSVEGYTSGAGWGSPHVYAGSVAKLAVLAGRAGLDPRDLGGHDLIERLEGLVETDGAAAGRLADVVDESDEYDTDYSNVLGQAYAAEALREAGSPVAASVLDYLLDQQCEGGWFRLYFADPEAADQSCDAGDPEGDAAPDTDTTAVALLALTDDAEDPAVADALDAGRSWLASTQRGDGSFGGGAAIDGKNANSTGLAGWALGELGACNKARDAARWLKRLQVGRAERRTALAGEKGAIAYDRAAWRLGEEEGITVAAQDQWRRASTQAAPALLNLRKVTCKQ